MVYLDKFGFIMSDTVHDGGDTARAHGMMAIFDGKLTDPCLIRQFVTKEGLGVRHPTYVPYDNPHNFTRDQLVPLIRGLAKAGYIKEARKLFWSHAKRLFWCQNIDRDYPGTRKSLFPQYYKRGQRFDSSTTIKEDGWVFRPNFRDPLWVHQIYMMAKVCEYKFFAFCFSFLAFPLMFLSLVFNSRKIDAEQNQLIALADGYGVLWLKLYVYFNPMWAAQTYYYWAQERTCPEMSNLIVDGVRARTGK